MKTRIIVVYATLFLLMSAALCLTMLRVGQDSSLPQYTTEINRLLIKLGAQWEDISANDSVLVESDEEFDYAVIDNNGGLKLYTRDDMSFTVSAATGSFDIIRDVEKDGTAVGKLIVHDPYEDIKRAEVKRSAVMMCGMCGLMLVFSLAYFIYLKKKVVDPFNKLDAFAAKIASGDLDTPLEMDRENIFGVFTGSFDIMREELKASRMREASAVKARKEMIAQLSHDIKTPIASIKAMADFLELTSDNEEQVKTIQSINNKADRIDKLVSNLFHATLEELEQLEVNPAELSSRELIQMVEENDHLNKVVRTNIEDCVIIADSLRLEQIVGNIISNSYKYADTEIAVDSFFEDGCLIVEFSDKGGGVPEKELDLVTEKFKRGSNAEGKDGSGIGLYISKYFISRMRGELSCRNNEEGFVVSLRFMLA